MDFKLLLKAISVKAKNKRKRFKGAAKSYVSLFLVILLVVVSTTAWFASKDAINVTTPVMEMKSSAGIHDSQLQTDQTKVIIPNFKLEEASSVDGRNIYFPAPYSDNANDATNTNVTTKTSANSSDTLVNWTTTNNNMKTNTTEKMRFREGNAGDKNVRYGYADVDIQSAGGETYVWLKGYSIKIGDDTYEDKIDVEKDGNGKPYMQNFPDPYTCPVRVAIIDDSGHKPKVFDPSARLDEYASGTDAVFSIKRDGTPTTTKTNPQAFSSYYYGTNNPLFTIRSGQKINLTVVAWLEGTHPYAKDYSGREMTLTIEVETNVAHMEEVYLHDWTIGDMHDGVTSSNYNTDAQDWQGAHWLTGNVNVAMQYYDTQGTSKTTDDVYKTTVMTELKGENAGSACNITDSDVDHGVDRVTGKDLSGRTVFKAAIPSYVSTDISFYRLSRSEDYDDVIPGTIFNAWHTYSGVNDHLLSSINNNGWKVLGNLAETRNMKNSTSTYTHYFAIRGNGFGNVPHDNRKIPNDYTSKTYSDTNSYNSAEKRYPRWLSPCIGYWGTANGPVSTS